MRLGGATLVAALVAGAAWTGMGPSAPAGAAVAVTSSGTTVSVTTRAGSPVTMTCTNGQIRAQGIAPSPPVSCAATTRVTVVGDDANDYINLEGLGSAFPVLAEVLVSPGAGNNLILGSPQRDSVVGTSGGGDHVRLDASGDPDGPISLGSGYGDIVSIEGTSGADSFVVGTGNPSSRVDVRRGTWSAPVTGARTIGIVAGDGDDVVDASTLGEGGVADLSVSGGRGNDTLRGGALRNVLSGGAGMNTLVGGPRADVITTESPTDTIEGRDGTDEIIDQGSGRVGGRTLRGPATADDVWALRADGDAAVRTRSNGDGSVRVTAALARTGVQRLGPDVSWIRVEPDGTGLPRDRVVLDLVALPDHAQRIVSTSPATIVDLVVPSGSWSRTSGTVTFSAPYGQVVVGNGPIVGVRSPFTDPEARFAHRVVRDTEMRLPTTAERQALQSQLESGATTRAGVVLRLTSSDTFRGLVVDRAFIDVLRRGTDAAGRDYWVGRLRRGLVTRKLRANLYGSDEYLSTQGGGTLPGFITAAYRDILGREADPAGLDYWVGLIRSGTPRGTVAERFLASTEARDVIVRDLFLRWVDREPTPTELATWRTNLASTTTDGETALVRFLAGSSAYFTRPDT